MDTITFGITLLVVGMGGTLATLWLLVLGLGLLTKLFPADDDGDGENGGPDNV